MLNICPCINLQLKDIRVTTGIIQGNALFLIVLNLVLEIVVRDMNISKGSKTIYDKPLSVCG